MLLGSQWKQMTKVAIGKNNWFYFFLKKQLILCCCVACLTSKGGIKEFCRLVGCYTKTVVFFFFMVCFLLCWFVVVVVCAIHVVVGWFLVGLYVYFCSAAVLFFFGDKFCGCAGGLPFCGLCLSLLQLSQFIYLVGPFWPPLSKKEKEQKKRKFDWPHHC